MQKEFYCIMKSVVQHEKYGEICYEESFWVGKPSLSINGEPLTKVSKKVFSREENGETKLFTLKGNYLIGASVDTGDEKIRIVPSTPWYVYVFAILTSAFLIAWGNSVELMLALFPIIGGAIGGGIIGASFVAYMIFPKMLKKPWQQLLVSLAVFLMATAILAMLGHITLEIIS